MEAPFTAEETWTRLVEIERVGAVSRAELNRVETGARREILATALSHGSNWERRTALTFLLNFPDDVLHLTCELLDLSLHPGFRNDIRLILQEAAKPELLRRIAAHLPKLMSTLDEEDTDQLRHLLASLPIISD